MTEVENKEIEEMAGIVCNNAGAYICMGAMYKGENYTAKEAEINLKVATALYEAGYRKESEVKAETAKTVREIYNKIYDNLPQTCDWSWLQGAHWAMQIAAEFGKEVRDV